MTGPLTPLLTGATDSSVLVTLHEHTLTLVINRPQAANAINGSVSTAIAKALVAADSDDRVRAVIVTGSGARFFSAGADIAAMTRGESVLPAAPLERFGLGGCTERTIGKPIIAAVNGMALGGGFELVLAADIVIAEPHATFGFPEASVGIFPGAGGAIRLSSWLPQAVASQLLLTGATLSATRASALGLVGEISGPGEVMECAMALAKSVAKNAPLAIRDTKRLLRDLDEDGASRREVPDWERSSALRDQILTSSDAAEGMLAFREKRPARWSGA